jgi:hypothetical protein
MGPMGCISMVDPIKIQVFLQGAMETDRAHATLDENPMGL